MMFDSKKIFNCNSNSWNVPKSVFLGLPFTLFIVTVVLLPLIRISSQPPSSESEVYVTASLTGTEIRKCNLFSGHWEPNPGKPYYSNETCPYIHDQSNCIKLGRPDTDFIKLRWKPNECDLPLFNATQFLNLVRGKTMAFVGDSIGRNQMESLLCLINTVSSFKFVMDRYYSKHQKIPIRWHCADYNFTLRQLWFPFLVKVADSDPRGPSFSNSINLYLDEIDIQWVNEIQNLDYVIVSAGQWFFRPMTFYENGQIVGYQEGKNNLNLYGYRQTFRTTLRTIVDQKGFKGLTFLVTHSPKHFEGGDWEEGGRCRRTKPFTKEEREAYNDGNTLDAMHQIQVEEFRRAEQMAKKKGLKLGLIDISDAMSMRPDAHPDKYGTSYKKNINVGDCVHWCTPGPIDTWNEFLLYMIKLEGNIKSTPI